MKCPLCKANSLNPIDLETGLPASQCSQCGGIWVEANPYQLWRRMHSQDLPRREDVHFDAAVDVEKLKLCPACGRILRRFHVIANVPLNLDRCASCNGVWLDNGEWQELVASNLHDNLNDFFTAPWQNQVRAEETKARMQSLYQEKFGDEDYARIRETRAWLQGHPQKNMLLAYLQAEDPYKL